MSDAPRPDFDAIAHDDAAQADAGHEVSLEVAVTDVDGNPIPSPELLAERALPAVYTRSPRLIRVVTTGGFVGAVVGAIIGLVLPSGFVSGRFATAMIMALAGVLAGALLAGFLVSVNETREAKHVAERKAEEIDHWVKVNPDAGASDAKDEPRA